MQVGVGRGVFGGVCVWVGDWVLDKCIVYKRILTISIRKLCVTQRGQKVDWVSFGKKKKKNKNKNKQTNKHFSIISAPLKKISTLYTGRNFIVIVH